jgi:hypothetical protein
MRFDVLFFAFLLAGCAMPKPDTTASSARTSTAHFSKPAAAGRSQKAGSKPEVRLDEAVLGTVVSVNPALRFLVMDFPVRKLPVLDQRLNIYRNGQKVGEVKVTGPARETTIAGDIIAGEAQVDDEVRED